MHVTQTFLKGLLLLLFLAGSRPAEALVFSDPTSQQLLTLNQGGIICPSTVGVFEFPELRQKRVVEWDHETGVIVVHYVEDDFLRRVRKRFPRFRFQFFGDWYLRRPAMNQATFDRVS